MAQLHVAVHLSQARATRGVHQSALLGQESISDHPKAQNQDG
jgi:hypothetical protein